MKIQVLLYEEDGELIVGLRSNSPFEDCLHDGEEYFKYYTVDDGVTEIETITIVPASDGWEIFVEEEQWDFIPSDGSHTAQFEIDV